MAAELEEIRLELQPLRALSFKQDGLLEKIDGLRSLSIGLESIPPIVVVGDVSSGKSSVLEAITRLPFPVRSGGCTTLTIEMHLRKSPQRKIEVTALQNGSMRNIPFDGDTLMKDDLARKFQEALSMIGAPNSTFSETIYRVNISGPGLPNLTLIDLPGLSQNTAPNPALSVAQKLATGYLQRKDTLILAVISAARPLAEQKALALAKNFDEPRERTIGVITKPDALEKYSYDLEYIRLVQNQDSEHTLRWGWHVLKNRNKNENGEGNNGGPKATCEERDKAEAQFLASGLWGNLQSEIKGVYPLRRKICTILAMHVAREMHTLDGQASEQLHAERTKLQGLGNWCCSENESDKRSFLQELANKFHTVASAATQGSSHNGEGVAGGSVDTINIRRTLCDLNAAFSNVMTTREAPELMLREVAVSAPHRQMSSITETAESWVKRFDESNSSDIVRAQARVGRVTQVSDTFSDVSYPELYGIFHDLTLRWHAVATKYIALAIEVMTNFTRETLLYISENNQHLVSTICEELVSTFFGNKDAELADQLLVLIQSYQDIDSYEERRQRQKMTWNNFHSKTPVQSQMILHQQSRNQVQHNNHQHFPTAPPGRHDHVPYSNHQSLPHVPQGQHDQLYNNCQSLPYTAAGQQNQGRYSNHQPLSTAPPVQHNHVLYSHRQPLPNVTPGQHDQLSCSNRQPLPNAPPESHCNLELIAYWKKLTEEFTEAVITTLVHQRLIRKIPDLLAPLNDPEMDVAVVQRLTQVPKDVGKKRKLYLDHIQCLEEGREQIKKYRLESWPMNDRTHAAGAGSLATSLGHSGPHHVIALTPRPTSNDAPIKPNTQSG